MTNGQDPQDYIHRRVHNRIQELQVFEDTGGNGGNAASVSASRSEEIPQQFVFISKVKRKIVVDILPKFNLTSYRGLLRAYEALARAEATAQQAARERDELARQLAQLSDEPAEVTRRLDQLSSERDMLAQQLAQLDRERDELARQVGQLSSERDMLAQQIDQFRSERDRLAQITLEQAEQLKEQQALYAALRDEHERFQRESLQRINDDLIAQNAWLRERLGYGGGPLTVLAEPAEALVHAQLDDQAYFLPQTSKNDSLTVNENDALYQTLETVLRGTSETIKARQALYLPYLNLNQTALPIVDIGCGRGEFLELMREQGVRAIGVDVNDTAMQALVEAGYEAHSADGIAFLQQQPDASLAGITAFQVIEHLPKTALRELIRSAHAKLVPGGFLLLETINPYCLPAYRTYYLDPTHHEPVPMDLLAILLRFYGFERLEVFYHSPINAKLINPGDREIAHRYENYALLGRRPQQQPHEQ